MAIAAVVISGIFTASAARLSGRAGPLHSTSTQQQLVKPYCWGSIEVVNNGTNVQCPCEHYPEDAISTASH